MTIADIWVVITRILSQKIPLAFMPNSSILQPIIRYRHLSTSRATIQTRSLCLIILPLHQERSMPPRRRTLKNAQSPPLRPATPYPQPWPTITQESHYPPTFPPSTHPVHPLSLTPAA